MAKEFPDLTGDGKVTKADILKGRGVPGAKKGGFIKEAIKNPVRCASLLGSKRAKRSRQRN
jgi:hypothetical protein